MKASRFVSSLILFTAGLFLAGMAACSTVNGQTTLPVTASPQNSRRGTGPTARPIALPTDPSPRPTSSRANSPDQSSTPSAEPPTPGLPLPETQTTLLLVPAPTRTQRVACDRAAPGSPIDVTIPDNTIMYPGQAFTKVWRLVNSGRCTWTNLYTVEWFSGDKLSDTQVIFLDKEVPAKQNIDITVDMVAPLLPGTYQSNWKLRNPEQEWFGIGPDGDQVFWVRIVVIEVATGTLTPTATFAPPSETPSPTFEPTITPTLTLTPTVTPGVLVNDLVHLTEGGRVDLDSAQTNNGGEDLAFQKDEAGNHWFVPLGGSILGVYGGNVPALEICRSANMSAAPIPVESLSPGMYLCYRTDRGLFGWLRYDSFDLVNASISLSILTWASP